MSCIRDDPGDGLPPPKSQYHRLLIDIGNVIAKVFGGTIMEVPNNLVAGVLPTDQKFLNALRRIKQAIETASNGGGTGGSGSAFDIKTYDFEGDTRNSSLFNSTRNGHTFEMELNSSTLNLIIEFHKNEAVS